MIGFFPDPYEDELLFSVCSRYHQQAGYFSPSSSSRDLFGRKRVRMAPDLPCDLNVLIERLPIGHGYDIDRMIDQHTLLPFYSPFVPHQRALKTRKDMAEGRHHWLHLRLGVNTSKSKWEFLRYCASCVAADRQRYGETYWHRLHQVPGVEVCPVHTARLRNSAVPLRHSMGREPFVTAEEAIAEIVTVESDEPNPMLPAQLKIANDVAWLLAHPQPFGYMLGHRQRYIGSLFERGLSTYCGKLNTKNLTEQVVTYYSSEFLETLECRPRKWPRRSWVSELVSGSEHTHAPLHHLLLIQFLGLSVEAFLQLPESRLPFGKAPWPCLNRANGHFGKNLISQCRLAYTQRNGRKPRGIFTCSCGFSYSRVGPDVSESNRFVIDRYVTFGKEFKEKVQELLDEGRSIREIATQLNLAPRTLEKLVQRIRSKSTSVDRRGGKKRTLEETQRLRKLNRKLLLDALAERPDAGRCEIQRNLGAPYNWLYKNDRSWLYSHLPSRKPTTGPPARIDWDQKDLECVAAVRAEADKILTSPGRPVRISSTAIARNLRIIEIVSKRPEKIPLTVQALEEVAESIDDHVIRRILWVGKCYSEEGISPAPWQVGATAGLRWDQCKIPKFKTVIEEDVTQLSDQLCLRYA
jgi:transposase-like protein